MYSQLRFFSFFFSLLLIKTNKSAQQSLQSRGTRYSYLDTARPSRSFPPPFIYLIYSRIYSVLEPVPEICC